MNSHHKSWVKFHFGALCRFSCNIDHRTVVHPDDPRRVAELRAVGGADGAARVAQLLAGDLRLGLGPLVVADPAPLAGVVDLHVSLQNRTVD